MDMTNSRGFTRVGWAVVACMCAVGGAHAAQPAMDTSGAAREERVASTRMEEFAPADNAGVSWNRVEPGLWRDEASERALPALEYAAVLPKAANALGIHRVLIVLPPGGQDRAMALAALEYVYSEAQRAGWVVVIPLAPKTGADAKGGDSEGLSASSTALIDRLCDHVARRVLVQGGSFHLAGISNGGRAAFRWATLAPERFASLTVLPGYAEEADLARIERLRGMPVRLFVGEKDTGWVSRAEKTRDALKSAGVDVQMRVLAGETHVLKGVSMKDILEAKSTKRSASGAGAPSRDGDAAIDLMATTQASAVLDLLHERSSKADERGYFELYTPEAIFLGTDATERWTKEQFRAYAAPAFSKGKGWTYHPIARRLSVSPSGDCVWFDEDLSHDRYGRCRGSGVLVRVKSAEGVEGAAWRLAQYNLSVPIPNEHLVNAVGLWKKPK